MTNVNEKLKEKKKLLDELIYRLFPDLSAPELVRAAIEYEQELK